MLDGVDTCTSTPLGEIKFARGWMASSITGVVRKVRRVFRVVPLTPAVQFGMHNNSITNLLRGLRERVFLVNKSGELAPTPQPKPGLVTERLKDFARRIGRRAHPTTPFSLEQFVACYDGRRFKVYSDAAAHYLVYGVRRAHAYLSTFVKAEKINFSSKPDPAPRVIQPRHPVYNVAVGRYIKRLEHPLYQLVNDIFGEVTIMKGHNAAESGRIIHEKWTQFSNPVAVGLDASRFDQHVSEDILRWEHSIYKLFYRGADREELARLLEWQLDNRGFGRTADGEVKYRVRGCRMSGDMNTGLGNCLIMCAMVHSYMAGRCGYRLANNGDDCVLFLEASDLHHLDALPEWFLELGFDMKVEDPVYDLEKVEFCQTHPIWTPSGWRMVRKHAVAQAKDCITAVDISTPTNARRWLKAVGDAGLALASGIPVQQEFYAKLAAQDVDPSTHPGLESGFFRLAAGMVPLIAPVDPYTRYSYWLAFGVLPDHQVAIEDELRVAHLVVTQPKGNVTPALPFSHNLFYFP